MPLIMGFFRAAWWLCKSPVKVAGWTLGLPKRLLVGTTKTKMTPTYGADGKTIVSYSPSKEKTGGLYGLGLGALGKLASFGQSITGGIGALAVVYAGLKKVDPEGNAVTHGIERFVQDATQSLDYLKETSVAHGAALARKDAVKAGDQEFRDQVKADRAAENAAFDADMERRYGKYSDFIKQDGAAAKGHPMASRNNLNPGVVDGGQKSAVQKTPVVPVNTYGAPVIAP